MRFSHTRARARSIAESNLRGVIDCIHKKHHISPRLALFGKLCGVLEPENYMPRLGDVVLNMCACRVAGLPSLHLS